MVLMVRPARMKEWRRCPTTLLSAVQSDRLP
jgi:hypothetical protein